MTGKKILVIEDNELNLKLVRTLLELADFSVLEALDAEQGIIMKREVVPPARVSPETGMIVGSPATVAAKMAEIEATGVGGVICSFRLGPMPATVATISRG